MRDETGCGTLREDDPGAAVAEVEHRWSNVLQILSSLIAARLAGVAAPEARCQLRWVQEMVRALAALQRPGDRLHATAGLVPLDSLLQDQAPHWRVLCEERRLRFVLETAPGVLVPAGVATGLSLAAVELVFNSCKHAFAEGQGGTIAVRLTRSGAAARLVVRDDGAGLPEALLPRADSGGRGLRLLGALAAQGGAALALGPGPGGRGTEARLDFRLPGPAQRSGQR